MSVNVRSPRIADTRLNCGYQLFNRPVRKGLPSSVMVWYVPTSWSICVGCALLKKMVEKYVDISRVVVRFGVKRPKSVPSSSWLPTMKGTFAYLPDATRSSGD